MKSKTKTKALSWLLSLALMLSLVPGFSLTAYAEPTEELLTTITATGKEQASYSVANVATVSFSYTAGGSSAYLANWGWWGYGFIATVTPADGYTITKCVFYDDANRTATDSEAPFVVETTEEDKTPKVNGTPILAYTSKGIKKIEVYGYATPAHTHSFTYAADGATITATCSAEGCELEDSKATLTLKAPENLIADGTAKAATIEGEIPDVEAPEIVYKKNGSAVNAEDVKEEGSYTASITLDDATASIDFAITAPYYTITIPAKLDAAKAGWNETAGISASGAIAEGKKLTVTATSANDWTLKNGENTITYYLSDAEDGDATTAWEFTDDELAANTTKPMGAVLEEYINKPAGNYTDTVTFTATVDTEKTITIGFNKITDTLELTYADGDTWEQIVNKNAEKIQVDNNNVKTIGKVKFGSEGLLYAGSAMVKPSDTIDPSANYLFRHLG